MMSRLFTCLMVLFLASAPAIAKDACAHIQNDLTADDALASVADRLDAHPYARGLHWRIKRDDAVSVIYGTVHMGDERIAIPASLSAAIESADMLLLEVDEAEMANVSSILSRLDLFFQIDGPDLRPMFTNDEWDKILGKIEQFNVPEIFANRMKPWALVAMLFVDRCVLNELSGATPGVDAQLLGLARENNVPVQGLEQMEDLLALLDGRDFEADMKVLKHLLSLDMSQQGRYPGFLGSAEITMDLYLREETIALWELTRSEARKMIDDPVMDRILEGVYAKLLIERNHNWLDTLIPMLEKGDVVVGVGALHLPGEFGLLHLLSERGFVVERITG